MFRNYELNVFRVRQSFASRRDISHVAYGVSERIRSRIGRRSARYQNRVYEMLPGPIRAELLNGRGSVYLDGFWQSPKYFAGVEDRLREEFRLWEAPQGWAEELVQRIRACTAVCVHVRRRDFVDNPVINVCSATYYQDAVRYVAARVTEPTFFVFSDDLEWCRQSLELPGSPVFVKAPPAKDRPEWRQKMMQECRHFIISNSTFCWWGAFLSDWAQRIVVAPKQWYTDPMQNRYSDEIILSGWVRL